MTHIAADALVQMLTVNGVMVVVLAAYGVVGLVVGRALERGSSIVPRPRWEGATPEPPINSSGEDRR